MKKEYNVVLCTIIGNKEILSHASEKEFVKWCLGEIKDHYNNAKEMAKFEELLGCINSENRKIASKSITAFLKAVKINTNIFHKRITPHDITSLINFIKNYREAYNHFYDINIIVTKD